MLHARSAVLLLAAPALLISTGCTMMPAEDDPVVLKQAELDARLGRVERVIESEGMMGLLGELDSLQQETRELRNQVELLEHELRQSGDRQREQFLDLDGRLNDMEEMLAARPLVPEDATVLDGLELEPGRLPLPDSSDRANYQAAFELLKQGRYRDANRALSQFLVSFPDSSLAANAQYWLGETHYVTEDFEQALRHFQRVIENYPDSGKLPDALLKIGYTNYELRRWDPARRALSTVVDNYPETTAARLAGQRLEQMAADGR